MKTTEDATAWVAGCPRSGYVWGVSRGTTGEVLAVCEETGMVDVRWRDDSFEEGWVDAAKLTFC